MTTQEVGLLIVRTEALAKGKAEGKAEGKLENVIKVIQNGLENGLSITLIAKLVGLKQIEVSELIAKHQLSAI
jgi:predicted transposase YdaD